jgi:hypothetical protein
MIKPPRIYKSNALKITVKGRHNKFEDDVLLAFLKDVDNLNEGRPAVNILNLKP